MGKALVLKNVSFSVNKLTTVEFTDSIPCTGIELNKTSTTLSAIGATETLVATVTPSNTTDSVIWTSDDPSVVSVSGGVLNQIGIGTATITATCGTESVSCTVTAVNTLTFDYMLSRYNHKNSASKDYAQNESGSTSYAAIQSNVATTKDMWVNDSSTYGSKYPILLGTGGDTVTINVPSTIRPTVWFCDSETACDYSASNPTYAHLAKVVSGDSSAYDSSVPLGNRTVTIPEGADSIVLSLNNPSSAITDSDLANVSIVVSKSAS